MSIEIKVPVLPESVSDATVAAWHKQAGEAVSRDENLVDLGWEDQSSFPADPLDDKELQLVYEMHGKGFVALPSAEM